MEGENSPEETKLAPAAATLASIAAPHTALPASSFREHTSRLDRLLAGVQSGVAGFAVSLVWIGIVSRWEGRSFWTLPNLMAGLFEGLGGFRPYFNAYTWTGLALHLLLTVAFATLTSQVISPRRRIGPSLGMGILLSTGWFYLVDGFFWRLVFPPFSVYSKRPSIFFGYVLIGMCVGLYSIFVRSDRGS